MQLSQNEREGGEQIALALLENGDYLRILIARDAARVLVQLGNPDPDDDAKFVWLWEMELTGEGAAQLAGEMAHAAMLLARRSRALADQTQASLADAQLRLAELQKEPAPHAVDSERSDAIYEEGQERGGEAPMGACS